AASASASIGKVAGPVFFLSPPAPCLFMFSADTPASCRAPLPPSSTLSNRAPTATRAARAPRDVRAPALSPQPPAIAPSIGRRTVGRRLLIVRRWAAENGSAGSAYRCRRLRQRIFAARPPTVSGPSQVLPTSQARGTGSRDA